MNHKEKFVIFGAWSDLKESGSQKILDENWQTNNLGRKQNGYSQSVEHARLVEKENYRLKIFQMENGGKNPETGVSTIGKFETELVEKELVRIGTEWFAVSSSVYPENAEDVGRKDKLFSEGKKSTTSSTNRERNGKARLTCIEKYGLDCQVCRFNFKEKFGSHGDGFIHVHHLTPVSDRHGEYNVDPEKDLIPVCPNCHAMLHRGHLETPLSVKQLKKIMENAKKL